MKFNVFALALICALSVAPVLATESATTKVKKAEVKAAAGETANIVKEAATDVKAAVVETANVATKVAANEASDVVDTVKEATTSCPSCK